MESSRQDLLNDMAEHSPFLKNNHKIRTIPIFVSRQKRVPLNTDYSSVFVEIPLFNT